MSTATAPALTVLSLGWGIQSWTLAAMSALGELPPIDFALHADTGWERQATYRFAARWTPWLEGYGVRVVTVENWQDSRRIMQGQTNLPAYTESAADGVYGQLRRQCTSHWKVQPMRRFLSSELARLGVPKSAGVVEQWLGISLDEWQRMKDADVAYIENRWPLIEKHMTRADCVTWLETHGLEVPVKSSCTFCCYHNAAAWRELKRQAGQDWQQAVEVDTAIRNVRPPYALYVHPARRPLPEAVSILEDQGAEQLTLDAGCDGGVCFV